MRPARTGVSFAALMLAAAVAAPAVGAFEELQNSGTTGETTFNDFNGSPGVVCKFVDRPGKRKDRLDKIKIAGHWAHGPYEQKTWVGSRYKIFKDTKPFDGNFKFVKSSKTIKVKGDDQDPANFGVRSFNVPDKSKARYRVRQIVLFYQKGSQKKVAGRIKGEYELYRQQLKGPAPSVVLGNEGGDNGLCKHKFWAPNPT